MNLIEFRKKLNEWGQNKVPFLFLVDFELKKPIALPVKEISPDEILFDCNGFTNAPSSPAPAKKIELESLPVSFDDYKNKFDSVIRHLNYGDSFLTNLTIKTKLKLSHSLRDLFFLSRAKYKLCYHDEFLVFSPETFIQINNGKIFSYPMKGTIDADLPNAHELILSDPKEKAEHVTIVDLIRNDVSQVALDVSISRFRYIEEIKTTRKNLLQVSSEIVGTLPEDYQRKMGDILVALFPAGSVSGAPKPKTVEIIREVEGEDRSYYTGVFGFFDGHKLDSGVMIRYIEKVDGNYFYRSGGGITTQSMVEKEYREAINKVYVPTD